MSDSSSSEWPAEPIPLIVGSIRAPTSLGLQARLVAQCGDAMDGSIISLICPAPALASQRTWWANLRAHWPCAVPKPGVQTIALGAALSEQIEVLGSVAILTGAHGPRARRRAMKMVDVLDGRRTPMLILADPADQSLTDLASERVVVAPADTPIDTLAGIVFALASRQPAVQALRDELNTARRFHHGLRSEMDRLHEELQFAAFVQRQFIPRSLPQIEGVEFGVLFRPCGYVSGDIYDVARLDDRLTGFFLADAVGHGVPAALMTMGLSKAMPSRDDDGALIGPAESLRRLNASMMKRSWQIQTFATCVCGLIDAADSSITIAGAGHPPPLRISASGVEAVQTEGSLLGVFEDGQFNEVTFRLESSEILLIHSDGFETAFPDDLPSDRSRRSPSMRYLDYFQRLRDDRTTAGVEKAMSSLAHALDEQTGSLHQLDDETVLVIAPLAASPKARKAA